MSHSNSDSSFWFHANKLIAAAFVVGAGFFPACFVYGGIHASYDLHHQFPTEVTSPTSTLALSGVPQSAMVVAQVQPTGLPSLVTLAAASGSADAGASEAQIKAGQTVFMTVCFACHQPTGLGLPNMFPPLAGSDWVNAPKPDRIIRNVLHGVMGPLKINGKPFTTPAPMMPPQASALTDVQIANVLTYVRNSWGNKASAVTPAQVKAIRDAEKSRTMMWSEADLLKIPDR